MVSNKTLPNGAGTATTSNSNSSAVADSQLPSVTIRQGSTGAVSKEIKLRVQGLDFFYGNFHEIGRASCRERV